MIDQTSDLLAVQAALATEQAALDAKRPLPLLPRGAGD